MKIAIIATSDKQAENMLAAWLTAEDYHVITINPDPRCVKAILKKECRRGENQKICFYGDKEAADYAEVVAASHGFEVEIKILTDMAVVEARRKLEQLMGGVKRMDTVYLAMGDPSMAAEFAGFFEEQGYEVRQKILHPNNVSDTLGAVAESRIWNYILGNPGRDLFLVSYDVAEKIRTQGGPCIDSSAEALRNENPLIFDRYSGVPARRLMDFFNLTLGFILPHDTPEEFWRRWAGCATN